MKEACPVGAADDPRPRMAQVASDLASRWTPERARASCAFRPSRWPVSATPDGVRRRGLCFLAPFSDVDNDGASVAPDLAERRITAMRWAGNLLAFCFFKRDTRQLCKKIIAA